MVIYDTHFLLNRNGYVLIIDWSLRTNILNIYIYEHDALRQFDLLLESLYLLLFY